MDGNPGDGVRIALYAVTFLEVLSAGFLTYMISILVLYVSKAPEKNIKIVQNILLGMFVAHAALLLVGWFTDLMYYFDEFNSYQRAPLYVLSNVIPLLMLLIDVELLVHYHKNIAPRVRTAFWIYMIAPIVAIVIQNLLYGIQFIIFAAVGAAVYMFAVIIQVQNEQYEKQRTESARIETELSMASSIQADMLPNIYPAFPDRPEFDIYSSMDPAKEVGGDFYDFFLTDDDHLCIVIADVSGKGVPAALFMMVSKIIIANNAMMGKTPAEILTDSNAAICANNRENMFVTVWLGILELSTGKLTVSTAGHEYPALRQKGEKFELVKNKQGFVLGGLEGAVYREYDIMLKPGATLFLYTDGVPEATDAKNKMFGTDRMIEALNINPDAEPRAMLKTVREAVDGFVGDAEQFDDLTMVCVEYLGAKG